VQPRVVICQSAQRNLDRIYAAHPDHLAAGEAAICAVYPDARNPFAFPGLLGDEGLEPWSVDEVWIMGGSAAERQGFEALDITDAFDRKIDALMCHQSQHTDAERITALMRGWAASNATAFGLPDGRLAEVFRVVDTR
jgi:LmbE family N-acetylglucosaminyl deacetylase